MRHFETTPYLESRAPYVNKLGNFSILKHKIKFKEMLTLEELRGLLTCKKQIRKKDLIHLSKLFSRNEKRLAYCLRNF